MAQFEADDRGEIVFCDYFMVDSDQAAVAEGIAVVPTAYPCAECSGVDPFVQMATIEAALTGESFDELVVVCRSGVLLVDQLTGAPVIVRMRAVLVETLAGLRSSALTHLAEECSPRLGRTVGGLGLVEYLDELVELAKLAERTGSNMYCQIHL